MEFFKPKPFWTFMVLEPIVYMFIFMVVWMFMFISMIALTQSRSEPSGIFAFLGLFALIVPFHFFTMIIIVLNLIYGIINASKSTMHSKDEKIMWIVLIVIFHMFVIPIYHFKYLRSTYQN